MMYRVLIADDEPSVIDSLKRSIDWSGLGLGLAACVSGGREMVEYLENDCADIAILDIRMPGMNGLELCEYIRQRSEETQIIIISGYAEFSYAERAIRYGVLGYCLKPLEYDKVTKLLLKAVQNLDKIHNMVSGADFLDALEGGKSDEIAAALKKVGLEAENYYVAVSIGEEKLTVPRSEGMVAAFGKNQNGYIFKEPLSEDRIIKYMEKEGNQGLGLCRYPVGIDRIPEAIDESIVQAYQFFIFSGKIYYGSVDETKAGELILQIQQNVEKNRWELVMEQLTLAEEKYRQYFTVRSAVRLANTIYTGSLFREEETDYYIYSFKQLVSEYGSFSGMIRRLKEAIGNAFATERIPEDFSNTAFMKLIQYIGENYKNEISLTSAGEALHMNPNYVSQLFKKEAGVTFVRYVTQMRIEDAIRLLTMTKKSAVDIAMEIGFNDYFYFLRTFKKFTGKTPSQYRQEY